MTGRKKFQAGYGLFGLCHCDGCLFVVEWQPVASDRYSYSLAAYQVHGESGDITLLDRLKLWETSEGWLVDTRVGRQSQHIFVPSLDSGVVVARLERDRLVKERTLTCIKDAVSVDVMSPNTVYVCDEGRLSVHIVDVRDDKIVSTLEKPYTVRGECPRSLAVLGDNVMVGYGYGDPTLVVYHHPSPAPVKVITRHIGLKQMTAVTTDCQRHFIVTDSTNTVFVMDVRGHLRHTVNIGSDSKTVDCAVVNRQLWIGCVNGDIVILS